MPAEGLDWLPDDDVLTDDEVVRLITIARRAARRPRGPVHRRRAAAAPRPARHRPSYGGAGAAAGDLDHHQRARPDPHRARARRGRPRPGQRQPRHRPAPRTSTTITRRDRLHDVVAGLEAAARRPGSARSRSTPCCCAGSTTTRRPSCCAGAWSAATSCGSSSRCRSTPSTAGAARRWSPPTRSSRRCGTEFTLEPAEEPRGSAPAELFTVDGGPHTVGVIASVTRPFCGDCDRVRLTADGQVRNCLFAREESDLRGGAARRRGRRRDRRPLAGRDDDQAARPRHRRRRRSCSPSRPMSAIGG